MKDYNGFSGTQRMNVHVIQQHAIKTGILPAPAKCELCDLDKGMMMLHNEDYDRPIDGAHPICVECHLRLHARFFRPVAWANHLFRLAMGLQSTPYHSVGAYIGSQRGGRRDEEPIPDSIGWRIVPKHWYQQLPSAPIIFRDLPDAEKARIR